jgi:hypothetical protein
METPCKTRGAGGGGEFSPETVQRISASQIYATLNYKRSRDVDLSGDRRQSYFKAYEREQVSFIILLCSSKSASLSLSMFRSNCQEILDKYHNVRVGNKHTPPTKKCNLSISNLFLILVVADFHSCNYLRAATICERQSRICE